MKWSMDMATDKQIEAAAAGIYDARNSVRMDGELILTSPLTWTQFKRESPGQANLMRGQAKRLIEATE